jgi:hypothetical protein
MAFADDAALFNQRRQPALQRPARYGKFRGSSDLVYRATGCKPGNSALKGGKVFSFLQTRSHKPSWRELVFHDRIGFIRAKLA